MSAQRSDGTEVVAPRESAPSAGAAQTTIVEDVGWREILPGLTLGSRLRLRTESRRNGRFDQTATGNDEDYLLSRLRVGFTWAPTDQVTGVVELQDARIAGEEAINQEITPNIFADQLDLHQAYLDVQAPASTSVPVTFRLGRQKLSYGTERLVSPLEWVNTARVFDGAKILVGTGTGRTLDVFATRLVPVAPTSLNDHGPTGSRMFNSHLYGAYYNDAVLAANTKIEGYWLLRRETRVNDAVQTVGGRIATTVGPWNAEGEVARQFGTFGVEDHQAMMARAGGSFTIAAPGRPTVGAAYNYGSGDDDPTDGVHGTFDNLYPLNHAYYGYMDLFALQNLHNLEVTAQTNLPGRATLRVAYQRFNLVEPGTDAWYNAGASVVHRAVDADISSHVGDEVDVTVRVPLWQFAFEVGYGHFFGGTYLEDNAFAEQSSDFFYLQTVVGF